MDLLERALNILNNTGGVVGDLLDISSEIVIVDDADGSCCTNGDWNWYRLVRINMPSARVMLQGGGPQGLQWDKVEPGLLQQSRAPA